MFLIMIPIVLSGCAKSNAIVSQPQDYAIAVEVTKVEARNITQNYTAAGKLYASEEVAVASKTKGKVASIRFDVGDQLKKGDVLYTLDNQDIIDNVNLQKSKLNKSLEDSKIRYEDALKDYNNMKILYEAGAISKDNFDNVEMAYNQAKLNYDQAQRDLNLNTKSLDASINDTIIRSPIDGIVASRNIEVGEMTTATDFVIVKLDPMIVKTNVSEDVINQISVGDIVKVHIQSKEYTGKISTISPVGINNGNVYPVDIQIENKDLLLKAGMFAEVYFEVEKAENQVVVPKNVILSKGNEDYVYVVEGDQPKKVVIEKGISDNGYVQILGGLKTGDTLVVKGQEYIEEGRPIKIVNQEMKRE